MRKTTISMGLALALTFGAAGAALAQSGTQAPPRAGAEEGRYGQRGARDENGPRGRRGPFGELLKGITLSDAQKSRLDAMRRERSPELDKTREETRAVMQDARTARERGDTAAARAKMEQLRAQMQQQRERQIAAMREVLAPDQRKQFDANLAEWKQHAAQGWQGGRRGRAGNGGHA